MSHIVGERKVVKIALVGAESVGKSTLALTLTGRLRTHGVLAALVSETGSSLPFPPAFHDTEWEPWAYHINGKIAAECAAVLRPNVEFVVSDRSPLDHFAYYKVRRPDGPMQRELGEVAHAWMSTYDAVYYLPAEGTVYNEDGFRASVSHNTWRTDVDAALGRIVAHLPNVHVVNASTLRMRSEWVYHHVLSWHLGLTRPLRAYAQVAEWFKQQGVRVVEARPQGSNSLTRFHAASDRDDIDVMLVVDGDALYARQVREMWLAQREHVENVVQATLDILVTPKGMEAHEV